MKTCYHCKQEKALESFASRQGKTLSYCIECYENIYGSLSEKKEKDVQHNRTQRKRQAKSVKSSLEEYLKLPHAWTAE